MVASFPAVEQDMPQARCLHQGYRDRPCLIMRSDLDVAAVVDHSVDCLAHLGLDAGDIGLTSPRQPSKIGHLDGCGLRRSQ